MHPHQTVAIILTLAASDSGSDGEDRVMQTHFWSASDPSPGIFQADTMRSPCAASIADPPSDPKPTQSSASLEGSPERRASSDTTARDEVDPFSTSYINLALAHHFPLSLFAPPSAVPHLIEKAE
jgi:hypothetical protein